MDGSVLVCGSIPGAGWRIGACRLPKKKKLAFRLKRRQLERGRVGLDRVGWVGLTQPGTSHVEIVTVSSSHTSRDDVSPTHLSTIWSSIKYSGHVLDLCNISNQVTPGCMLKVILDARFHCVVSKNDMSSNKYGVGG